MGKFGLTQLRHGHVTQPCEAYSLATRATSRVTRPCDPTERVTRVRTQPETQPCVPSLKGLEGSIKDNMHVYEWLGVIHQEVVIEGDALMIVKKLRANRRDRLIIRAYIKDSKSLCLNFRKCVSKHTPQLGNEVAHLLATKGLRREWNIICLGECRILQQMQCKRITGRKMEGCKEIKKGWNNSFAYRASGSLIINSVLSGSAFVSLERR
ncbi:hypothetical protein CXB51_009541 [Gossypium anomalum]|uniref:RNase H type-1 domain-containing protein n=1 Tax=Gossypium anomalum TaxID=47600 RepID=A0A8J5Z247_9ROSI|nr:hypothetical protein CXB51_009541 [Gossypium anomalum]